jgi:hypothetical protein
MGTEDFLAELLSVAQEQLRWQRAAVLPQVRTTVEQALQSTQLRTAYELCDGEHTLRQIGAAVNAGVGSVSRRTKTWRDLGIAFEGADGRIQHLVSLASLGLPVDVADATAGTR